MTDLSGKTCSACEIGAPLVPDDQQTKLLKDLDDWTIDHSDTSKLTKQFTLKNYEQSVRFANLIADFWYTAWVDAGKPDLSAFENTSFAQDLQKELGAYQQNSLVKDGFLRALKR